MIQGLGNIFAIGSASLISRLLGAKRFDEAKSASSVSFYTTILLGILISIGLLLFKDPLIRAIGSSPSTFEPANSYFSIIALFAVPMVLNVAMGGQIRAEGAATHAMIGMIIGLGLNIILDPILILWLDMKAAGAAWATVIGAMCSVAYFISYFLGKKSTLSISPTHFKPSRAIYGEILKIGGPAALSQVVMSGSAMLNNIVAASFGDYVVAGVGVYMRVGSLCLILLMGPLPGIHAVCGL